MPREPFLILSEKWAVGADRLQWIVYQHFAHAKRGGQWTPVAFVATTKAVLLRCLREKGAVVTTEGQAALERLPDTFKDWQRRIDRGAEGAGVPEVRAAA